VVHVPSVPAQHDVIDENVVVRKLTESNRNNPLAKASVTCVPQAARERWDKKQGNEPSRKGYLDPYGGS